MAGSTAAISSASSAWSIPARSAPGARAPSRSASMATNDIVYGNRGIIYKQQYNARIYQPIGNNGDFISLAIHYNQNRNNFFGSMPLRQSICSPGRRRRRPRRPRIVGSAAANRFPLNARRARLHDRALPTNQVARPGLADAANTCGSDFEERLNPSDTGNMRMQSRFTLTDGLVLTVDPSFQWVKANGGGTVVGQEGLRDVNPAGGTATPERSASPARRTGQFELPDRLSRRHALFRPRPQRRRRPARHRPRARAEPDPDPSLGRDRRRCATTSTTTTPSASPTPSIAATTARPARPACSRSTASRSMPSRSTIRSRPRSGDILQKRDRVSIALLNQISAEYRGEFIDGHLTVNAGVRAPFFSRDLTNNCATSSASGFVECFGTNTAGLASYLANNDGQYRRRRSRSPARARRTASSIITRSCRTSARSSTSRRTPASSRTIRAASRCRAPIFSTTTSSSRRHRPGAPGARDDRQFRRRRALPVERASWPRLRSGTRSSRTVSPRPIDPELDQTCSGTSAGSTNTASTPASPGRRSRSCSSMSTARICGRKSRTTCSPANAAAPHPHRSAPSCPAGLRRHRRSSPRPPGRRESGAPVYTFGGRIQAQLGPLELGIRPSGPARAT